MCDGGLNNGWDLACVCVCAAEFVSISARKAKESCARARLYFCVVFCQDHSNFISKTTPLFLFTSGAIKCVF